MKKLLLAGTATLALTGAASAEDVKMGIILGFTGPLESITPNMASGAELAVNEVNEAGTLLEDGPPAGRALRSRPADRARSDHEGKLRTRAPDPPPHP